MGYLLLRTLDVLGAVKEYIETQIALAYVDGDDEADLCFDEWSEALRWGDEFEVVIAPSNVAPFYYFAAKEA